MLCNSLSRCQKTVYALLSTSSEQVRGNIALFTGMCLYTALNYFGQRLLVFGNGK